MIETLTGEAHRPGRIEVVCGSMFSGKTEELIRRLKRAKFARQRVIIFKPVIDTRYSDTNVVSHDHNAIPSTPLKACCRMQQDTTSSALTRHSFSMRALSMCATSWLTAACALLLRASTWISRAFPSVRCLPYAPLPTRLPRCTPSA